MHLPGGNQHNIPDPTLFDANYADGLRHDRMKSHGLAGRVGTLLAGVVAALAFVAWAAWWALGG